MNFKSFLAGFIVVFIIIVSCKNKESEATVNSNSNAVTVADDSPIDPANLKKVSFNIEGMTCEIGCAKTIQSKLAKSKGVQNAVVNFDEKLGNVTYDSSKISVESIVEIVEKIGGGDLYSVSEVQQAD
ncbi:MAG: heavy metal transporter [Flavobacteriales bacterium]|nr:MAG: heavy metal transporter [Flavobacteriales bacterium]PIE48862.1 MAG: heavy metal transporter [Flavobacteriales bacterium]